MIFDLENLPLEEKEKNEELAKLLCVGQAESSALAAHVVLYKSLGLFKNSAIVCMLELHRRRSPGEEFEFEDFIDLNLSKLPKVQQLDLTALNGLVNIQQISSFIKRPT